MTAVTEPMPVLDRLRAGLRGRLLTAADPDYEKARIVMIGSVDARPLAIARVLDAADVAHVIAVAREDGLEIAVRSGGHDGAGNSTTEGGVVIDMRDMKAIAVDAARRVCIAETGATAGEVTAAVGEHGLVIGFGDTGSVGIGGITLGGGIGYMVRRYGMTIDNLLAAEIVTADGEVLRVDAESHPDLFWAIRGGGGNFGVATRFEYRLHELPEFTGGMLVLPLTPEILAGFMQAAANAPETLSTIANAMNCPPMPFLPEEVHGQLIILAFLAYSGQAAEAEQVLAPFYALAEPLADMVGPSPYSAMFAAEEGAEDSAADYRPKVVERPMFLDRVDLATARAIVAAVQESDASMRAVQLRALGGAMARVPADATAFAHRTAPVMAQIVSFYETDDELPRRMDWVRDLAARIDQGVPGAYVNFLGSSSRELVQAAYPEATYRRLAEVKRRYDPHNVFHRNHNVALAP